MLMASPFMKVGQHKRWLMPQICPGGSRQSDLGSLIPHSHGRARHHNSLSSLSSISSFSRRALLPQTAIHGMQSNRGVACSARLAPGIPTEVYVVKRGDWLSDVAAARNMDVYDLKELNPSLDLDNIYVGQEIIVPVMKPAIVEDPPAPPAPPPPPTAVAPSPAPPSPAVIEAAPAQGRDKPGSGKLSLGNLFGRHEAATAVVEPTVEAKTESDDGFTFEVYTMKRGEWVSSVASRFGVTLDELRAANPNVNLDNVRPKQSILIPRPTAEPLVKTLADPGPADMCAPPTASPSPAPQLNGKPSPDMCAPPAPKPTVTNVASQGAGKGGAMLLDGSAGRKQQQGQKQQSRKGGGSNNEANMCCAPPPNPASQSTAGLPSSSSSGSEVYVVKRGDWMSTVASDRGLSLDELRQLNPGLNLDRVRVGQEILVPRKEVATAVPPVPDENVASEYMIQPGDFMDTIAQRHGVSVSDIVELNSLSYDEPIQVGQTIYIPKPKPPEFELTTSTLYPEVGMPPMPPLVVGGLIGVGTALLTIAAIGFALSDRGPPAATAAGSGSPSPLPGSRQVRGRPVVVAAESSSTSAVPVAASASAAAATGEPPLASSAGPRMSSGGAGGEGRPIKMGSTNGNGNGNGSGFSSSGNGNGAVRSQNRKSASSSSSSSSGERRGGVRGSSPSQGPTSTGLPPEVERATLAAVEAVRGGGAQGPGALRVGDGYARADSVTNALQDAVRAAVASLGSAPPTVALAAIRGGRGDADSGSYSRTEEAVLLLRKILPRDCTLHGVNAGGGEAASSRDEGSQEWAAVLLLSAPDVIVSSSVALGYGGARLASQQAIESLTTKVSGKKQIKSVVVNASPGLGPTAVEEVASMLPGVPAYSVSAGRGMATSEWQVIAGPSASAVSPGVSAIGLTADAEFGGAFLATVTGQWLYGPRSVVAARPPSVAISRS